jgi:hypothetical protein
VVVLCPASPRRPEVPDLQWIPASSSYEAAAEILSAPTVALVVDLTILSKGHLKLLDVARQMATEVLAIGAIPTGLTSEELSGVRLVSKADLPAALRALTETEAVDIAIEQGAAVSEVIQPERVADSSSPGRPGGGGSVNAPSPGELAPNTLQELLEDAPISAPDPKAGEAEDPKRTPSTPSELLSDAELAALLEDEP